MKFSWWLDFFQIFLKLINGVFQRVDGTTWGKQKLDVLSRTECRPGGFLGHYMSIIIRGQMQQAKDRALTTGP